MKPSSINIYSDEIYKLDFLDSADSVNKSEDPVEVEGSDKNKEMEENMINKLKNESIVSNITLGLKQCGLGVSSTISRSLSPTTFRKKTQQMTSIKSRISSTGSGLSSPKQTRQRLFSYPLDRLFGSELSSSPDQARPTAQGNMVFLGQIYREHIIWIEITSFNKDTLSNAAISWYIQTPKL